MTIPSQLFGQNCRKCNTVLSADNMYAYYIGKICKFCVRMAGCKKTKKYRDTNYEQYREKSRAASTKYYNKIKQELFNGYGNKCACCGETEPKFLSIDHVNNDGYIERGNRDNPNSDSYGINLYKKIIRLGFPDKYQLLCMNCNFGKRMNNGVCPHKERCNDYPLREYDQVIGSALPAIAEMI